MTTTRNDSNLMSEEQLDTVAAGSAFVKLGDVQCAELDKSSPKYHVIGEPASLKISRWNAPSGPTAYTEIEWT